jgi:hypothetical protein
LNLPKQWEGFPIAVVAPDRFSFTCARGWEWFVRPKTIVYFEWIIFGTLLLAALQIYLSWDRVIAQAATPNQNSVFVISMIFGFVLVGTLTLLVSRRRSKIAMWVSIANFAIGLSGSFVQGQLGSDNIMTALVIMVQVVAYGLLFTPSARRWMNQEDEKPKLHDVFD